MLTDWFITQSGVKQGDTLSPTLFGIFFNDIAHEVNNLNLGINIGNRTLSILLYADDIVLLSDTEEGLQTMLNTVYAWSMRNMITFNDNKSKIVHYRKSSNPQTTTTFYLGDNYLSVDKQHKYLGIIFDEFVDFNVIVNVLADAGNRALGAIINKYKQINGLGYYTYIKLYNSCIYPILDYCAKV